MIKRLLIANRGEIACRIMRTAHRMGIETVAVYSDADCDALHREFATHAAYIGPAPATQSYLDVAAIMAAAAEAGADAIHPGYGFLSESPALAEACAAADITFVGPPADAMRQLGLKDEAKRLAVKAGVPIVPGYFGAKCDAATLVREAGKIGYPLMVKAIAGGGGRGMRPVAEADALADAIESAAREAEASFGDARLMIEKIVLSPRHIEVQVFGDTSGDVVHLYERDCTLQRRHQKVIEEAPAPGMSDALRKKMTDAAVTLTKAVGYVGAGTVEFLVEGGALDGDAPFYFIEMNTRLQVEHPVTEAVTGLDLVEWQLRVAAGEPLPRSQDAITLTGHAIEARLYAEDPSNGFQPSVGHLHRFDMADAGGSAAGADVRVDSGLRAGDDVSPHYDAMIAKLIAHGADRSSALATLDAAFNATVVLGVETNTAFLRMLLRDGQVQDAQLSTGLIAELLARPDDAVPQLDDATVGAAAHAILSARARSAASGSWNAADGFQLGAPRRQSVEVLVDDAPREVVLTWPGGTVGGSVQHDRGPVAPVVHVLDQHKALVWAQWRQWCVAFEDPAHGDDSIGAGNGHIRAPITGRVAAVNMQAGADVEAGDAIMVIEAMKMEHILKADVAGTLESVNAGVGDQVANGDLVAVIAPSDEA